ncbi:Glycoside hydrolase [Coniochaeta hoffmannii]|uniref:Probable beta-glucosidase btgE n=1 Tax=Coniochaeta hoffmannii TaxID=91930 RepID=A0AA38RZ61_9PEZI|nr:Glycoside hydrolase [Coniochaeta hoffmannii]
MKASFVAAAAALLAGGASAGHVHHRHAHDLFKAEKRGNDSAVCVPGCTTIYSTITGPAGLYTPPAAPSTSKPAAVVPTTSSALVASSPPALVPTPIAQTCPTPGTYTFPATTVVVTETTTVCAASTTKVPSGTHTLGGVTTVVTTATTVVCPYATTKTEAGVVTSVIETTTYICPSAGTYTIAPVTTVVATETVVVVPVVTTYCPGTYTAPAVVTTITETDVVIYCPFTSTAPAAPAVPTAAPPPPPPSASPASTPAASPSASPSASTPLGTGGKQLGVTYTPYQQNGECKDSAQVMADIGAIKQSGVDRVRVYSTDCDTLPNVGAACEAHGVKIIAGIFIGEVGCDNGSPDVAEQISALKAWAQWDLVDLIVIGNEALFNGFCTVSQLHDLIVHVKTEIASTGYTGPVTTTDVVSAWIGSDVSSICEVIDFPSGNIHAYFNGGTTPEQAGDFVAGQLQIIEHVCGKEGLILESGWPTAGKCIENACPGKDAQKTALASIVETCGSKTVFFSYTDDLWKRPGDCECERSWGCGDVLAEIFGA